MKRLIFTVLLAAFAIIAPAQSATKSKTGKAPTKAAAAHEAKMVAPDQLMWSPLLPGIERAVVLGDPSKAGTFVLRLRATDDAKIPPHWHPTDEYVTVLAGDASVGMGKSWDDSKLNAAPVHAAAMLPARMPHYAQFKKGTEVQVTGSGPFVINFVNPADDPNKKK